MIRCHRGSRARRLVAAPRTWLGLAVCVLSTAPLATIGAVRPAEASQRPEKLILYSVAEQEQFINNADDRTRGGGNNPFGNNKDVTPTSNKATNGPFPGDEAIFSFNLYTSSNLRTRAGSAIFTCQYNYDKNAFCDAAFHLNNGGTLVGAGAFNFNAAEFTFAVTGSYGTYADKTGTLEETPSAHHAERLVFVLG